MFKISFIDGGYVPALEYMTCGDITPKLGMMLGVTDGELSVAVDKPLYMSVMESEETQKDKNIPVMRVHHGIRFLVETEEDFSAAKIGGKASVSADGMSLTAGDGGAEITDIEKTEDGYKVTVRFN